MGMQTAVKDHRLFKAAEIRCHEDIQKAVAAGADMGVLNHAIYYGISSVGGLLPICNPNEMILRIIEHVQPFAKELLMVVGLCGTEPFRIFETHLQDMINVGVTYIQNYPTVGMIGGNFRRNLEAVQFTYHKECLLMKKSAEMGFGCLPLVFDEETALQMIDVGMDTLILHPGPRYVTVSGRADDYPNRVEMLARTAQVIKTHQADVKILIYTKDEEQNQWVDQILGSDEIYDGVYYSMKL